MAININGTPGTAGTNGANPTAGTVGGNATFNQSGTINGGGNPGYLNSDGGIVNAVGGTGGAGGNGVAVPGANGGNGGNASLTFSGNIFNAMPTGTTVSVQLNATGGNGGAGGTGTSNGTQGKGGNATVTASGNIFQFNKILTSFDLTANATGGTGSTPGNATSTVNGNIFQTSKLVGSVSMVATAQGGGTNAATLNGNIIQGNVNNANLVADTTSGGTATINGNIVQTNATNTGFVTLEASGGHIAITGNKFTLGLQELDFSINTVSPYSTTITGNTFKGTGANIFKFSDIANPGPVLDSVNINLVSQTMVFDGQASNAFSGFGTLVGLGNAFYTFIGDDNANTLTGAGLNDTFTGGKGNDAINGNGGTDTAIYSGNHLQYNIVLDGLGNGTVTDTVANRDGADTLTSIERLQFSDGTYIAGVGFVGFNNAPILDASKAPTLSGEALNSPAPVGAVGTLVSSLVDFAVPAGQVDNVTDPDLGAQLGIALTGANTTNGTWFYSTNGGANWFSVPAVTDGSALLLAADANTRLYFQPTTGYTGTDTGAITFRAWDQTSGSNGQSGINASINGGTTAFSAVNDTASLTVGAALNTAPVLDASKSPVLATEAQNAGAPVGMVGTLVDSLVDFASPAGQVDNVTDPDAGAQLGIALTGTDQANGTWFYSTNNGTTWNNVPTGVNLSDSSALLLAADGQTRLYFQPNGVFTGTDAAAITFRAWDRTTGTNGQAAVNVSGANNGGSTAFSTVNDTAAITITAANVAPMATNLSAPETYTEDMPLNLTDIVVTDPDGPTTTATLTLSNPLAGALSTATSGAVTSTYNTGTGVWTASGAIADVNALLAGVTFNPTLNFNSGFTIATSVTDGIAPAVTGTKVITGTPVNDAPTATNLSASETYTEDMPLNLVDIVVSDVDNSTTTATLTLSNPLAGSLNTGTSGAVTSTYNTGTGVWTASGNISDVNALLAGVTFTPTLNFNSNFSIATSVTDGIAPAVTGTKAFTGVAVNDAPTATNLSASETYTEDTPLNLIDIVVSDVDNTTTTATLTLSNPLAGALSTGTSGAVTSTYNTGTGVWTASGAIADVNALLAGVTFNPALDFNGNFTVATSVTDGIAPPVTGTKAFTGIAVNDAPVATNLSASETYTEDTPLNLTDIVVSDVDNTTTTATLTLSNPLAGALSTGTSGAVTSTYNTGTGVWTASGAIANVNALLAGVTFNPALNFNSNFTVTTSVTDGIAAPVTGTKNFTGIPVNDAPTATNLSAPETYTEDTPLNLTDIVVSDVDNTTTTATLTLSNPLAGALSTGTSGAVTSTYNTGTGVWTASGAIANVNALLAGVTFNPALNFNGNFTVATSVTDGIAPAVTGTKAFTGVAVNDAPVATNDSYITGESQTLVVGPAGGVLSNDTDVDGDTLTVGFITTPTHGSLGIGANGAFTYTPNAGYVGTDTFTYQATDGSLNSNTATVTITVDGAPVANDDSYATGFNTPLVISAAGGLQANDTDPEADPLTSTVVTGPAHGALTLNADGSFTYTPDGIFVGTDTFTYRDNDGVQNSNIATVSIDIAAANAITSPPAALFGTPGDDFFVPDATTTSIDGVGNTLTGGDTVSFSNATSGIIATTDAGAGTQDWTGSGLGMTSLTNIENLSGSAFNDVLSGTDGVRNTLKGGGGDDTLMATTGDAFNGDTLDGGAGNDTADFSLSTDTTGLVVDLSIVGSQDVGTSMSYPITLTSIENLTGSNYADLLIGDAGNNVLNGGNGADTLIGGAGDDFLDGGDGVGDTADYSDGTQNGLRVDLTTGTSSGGGLGNDTLVNINNINGSTFNDTLIGDAGNNVLFGDAGNDILMGGAGNNNLDGGAGTDVAYYAGREAGGYAVVGTTLVANAGLGILDMGMTSIERLKFLSPTHVMDVDNDGFGDQFYQDGTGAIQVVSQFGTTPLMTNPGATNKVVGTGQFDPDNSRVSGMLLQDSVSGNVQLVTGINTLLGTSDPAANLTGAAYSTTWKAIGTGDFNGDASSDILMWDQAGNHAEILLLKENDTDAVGYVNSISQLNAPGAANWKPIAAGDFNGDGKSDILWQNTATKAVEVYLTGVDTAGNAVVTNTPASQATANLTAIGTGDFNGDGKSDVLFQNASGQAVIWFMNGDSHVGTKTVAKPGTGFAVSGSQDVDSNGYSDIIWTNASSGAITASEFGGPSSMVSATVTGNVSLVPQSNMAGGFKLVASTGGG